MSPESVKEMILNGLQDFGLSAFAIVSSALGIGIAYIVFRYGWRLVNDQSLQIGGFYLRNTPWKGYNRWRSKKWNIEHM